MNVGDRVRIKGEAGIPLAMHGKLGTVSYSYPLESEPCAHVLMDDEYFALSHLFPERAFYWRELELIPPTIPFDGSIPLTS